MGILSERALARRMDEKELSRKITAYLNKETLGFRLKFIDSFCDIADEKNKVFIEIVEGSGAKLFRI